MSKYKSTKDNGGESSNVRLNKMVNSITKKNKHKSIETSNLPESFWKRNAAYFAIGILVIFVVGTVFMLVCDKNPAKMLNKTEVTTADTTEVKGKPTIYWEKMSGVEAKNVQNNSLVGYYGIGVSPVFTTNANIQLSYVDMKDVLKDVTIQEANLLLSQRGCRYIVFTLSGYHLYSDYPGWAFSKEMEKYFDLVAVRVSEGIAGTYIPIQVIWRVKGVK